MSPAPQETAEEEERDEQQMFVVDVDGDLGFSCLDSKQTQFGNHIAAWESRGYPPDKSV